MKTDQGTGSDPFKSVEEQGDQYQTQLQEDLELAKKRIHTQEEDTEAGYTTLDPSDVDPSDVDPDSEEDADSESGEDAAAAAKQLAADTGAAKQLDPDTDEGSDADEVEA
jgi:hypothetical protein